MVGVKLTGTVSCAPAARVCGSELRLAANGADAETALTVTVRVAVKVTVPVPVLPTGTDPRFSGEPVSAAWDGWPNAISTPSRVPT